MEKFAAWGITTEEAQFMTASYAACLYMKEHYEDDRCIIPEEIKKMSNEELQKKIAQFEQAGKTHKAAQVPYRPTRVTLPYHLA